MSKLLFSETIWDNNNINNNRNNGDNNKTNYYSCTHICVVYHDKKNILPIMDYIEYPCNLTFYMRYSLRHNNKNFVKFWVLIFFWYVFINL